MSESKAENKTTQGMENAAKAGIWYTISSIVLKGISIFTTPIFTRLLTTSDYGIVQTFLSWSSIFSILCSLNLGYSIGRAKQDFPGKLNGYIGAMESLSMLVTAVIGITAVVFVKPVSRILGLYPILIVLLVLYVLVQQIISLNQASFRYQYRYKENIFISFYGSVVPVVLSLVFIQLQTDNKYLGKISGTVIASSLLALYLLFFQIKNKNISINYCYWKYGLKISLPLIVHTISLNILSQSDRIVINSFCGSEAVGIYSLAYTYALLINVVLDSINQAWNPWFHDNYHLGNYRSISKNVKPLVVLGCMLGIGCISIAPEAILLLGGDRYLDGKWVVLPVVLGTVCQYVYSHYVIIEMHLKKTIYVSIGTVIAATINLLLNYLCIPRFGYIAAGYTTLVSYLILYAVHYGITRYCLHIRIYDDRFMILSIIVTMLISMTMAVLFSHIIIRYIFLILLCVIWIAGNKKYLISFINKRKHKNQN